MASNPQGVYEPSDDVHVFDGSEDEEDTEGSRLPLLIVIALFVLAAFGGVVWLAYEKGVASGRTEPRTIMADASPAKVAPDNQGETQTPYKGLKIYEQPAPNEGYDGTAVENTAPRSAPVRKSAPSATPALRAPLTEAPVARPPVGQTLARAPLSIQPRVRPTREEPATTTLPTPFSETPPAQPPTQGTGQAPAQQAEAVPGVTTPEPTTATPPAGAVDPDTVAKTEPPAALPAPAAAEPTAAPHGAYLLQIGSYKSPAEADAAWGAFQAKHSALTGGFSTNVKEADLGDKGLWYRLRFGPFPDRDTAAAMCERIRSDGGTCIVSK
jgi:cell division protein FtsN